MGQQKRKIVGICRRCGCEAPSLRDGLCSVCACAARHGATRYMGKRVVKTCPDCGKEFGAFEFGRDKCPTCTQRTRDRRKYYTPVCKQVTCARCGREFRAREGIELCCSCRHAVQVRQLGYKGKLVPVRCPDCGREFFTYETAPFEYCTLCRRHHKSSTQEGLAI